MHHRAGLHGPAGRAVRRPNVKVIGLSCDTVDDHVAWSQDIEDTQGIRPNFPMIGDADRTVADLYDMIHPNASDTMTVRSVFVIAPDNTVKLTITYPASTGRNFDEVLRVIDSLQLTATKKVPRRELAARDDDDRLPPSPMKRPPSCFPAVGRAKALPSLVSQP